MEARKRRRLSIMMSNTDPAGAGTKIMKMTDDIIVDILSRLPVKCVLRCRCVCKSWNIITQQKFFIEKHQRRRNKCSEIIYEYENEYKSEGDDETYVLRYHCNGLVLEFNKTTGDYRVRNPATKQVLPLPAASYDSRPILGFDSSTGNYKMFRLSDKKRASSTPCVPSIITIGNDDDRVWRSFGITLAYRRLSIDRLICLYDVCYTFDFYLKDLRKTEIMRFTMDEKTPMNIKAPESFQWNSFPMLGHNDFQVFFLDDVKLSIGFIIRQDFYFWVLEDYSKHIWSEKKVVHLDFMKDYPNPGMIRVQSSPSLAQLRVSIANHYVEYDIYSKKYLCLAEAPQGKQFLYELTPSLVSLKGMRSEVANRIPTRKAFLKAMRSRNAFLKGCGSDKSYHAEKSCRRNVFLNGKL